MEKWQNQFYIQKILNVVHYSLFPFPHLEKSCLSCTICIGSYYLTSHLSLGRDGKQYLNRHFLGYRRKWSNKIIVKVCSAYELFHKSPAGYNRSTLLICVFLEKDNPRNSSLFTVFIYYIHILDVIWSNVQLLWKFFYAIKSSK